MFITPEEREKERLLFDAERKRAPELFVVKPMIDDDEALRKIGIEHVPEHRQLGYLKLLPQDFIVEEISKNGTVHTVDLAELAPAPETEGGTYYVDLVKVGVSTIDAKVRLAHLLGIDEKEIGYTGIKDRFALTSQTISIRGLAEPEKLSGIHDDNFFLKNLHRGKGVLVNGALRGNRFTITVRTAEPIGTTQQKEILERLQEIKAQGFWNFFYFQRFGTPRLLSHVLGRLITKTQYEETIKQCCIRTSPYEPPYINAIREEMAKHWGDWNAIMALIDPFPACFDDERTFMHHLIQHPADFLGALRSLPDQIRLWIYAYACHLFNRKLSGLIALKEIPLTLPFITSHDPNDWKPYEALLREDDVKMPSRAYKDFFPMVHIASRRCPTLQNLTVHNAAFKNSLAVFSFSLPKGSYATTFLMNFFTLATELPQVPGAAVPDLSTQTLLNVERIAPVLERFKNVLEQTKNGVDAAMEE
jgi:TruD family tRNA pseudouridine synthase